MAVLDEVQIADPVDVDRGQVDPAAAGGRDPTPSAPGRPGGRPEGAIEGPAVRSTVPTIESSRISCTPRSDSPVRPSAATTSSNGSIGDTSSGSERRRAAISEIARLRRSRSKSDSAAICERRSSMSTDARTVAAQPVKWRPTRPSSASTSCIRSARERPVGERARVLLDLRDGLEPRDRDRALAARPDPAERALDQRAPVGGQRLADRGEPVEELPARAPVGVERGHPVGARAADVVARQPAVAR